MRTSRAAPPEAVPDREQKRPAGPAHSGERTVERRGAEPRRAHLVVRERLSHRDGDAAKHRSCRRQHRHDEPDQGRQHEHPGRHREARDVEVQEHRQVAAERPAAPEARRHRHHEGRAPEHERLRQVESGDPPVAAADRLHHADLADLRGDERRQQVHHQDAAQREREEAEARHQEQQQAHQVGVRVLPRLRNVDAPHAPAAAFDEAPHALDHAADVRLVHPVAGHEQLELVEVRLLAELGERRERDVAVDDLLHPRLGLPDVGHRAAHAQRALDAAGRAHLHRPARSARSRPGARRARPASRPSRAARRPAAA